MTEQQLRDVLARVVPEPPDSVADASPVVRAARRRRRARVAGVSALAAVVVAGAGFGIANLGGEPERDTRVVADQPSSLPDPYTSAPCPDPQQPWDAAPLTDLSQVIAIRYCARQLNGIVPTDGPRDALVSDLDVFTDAFNGMAVADPARCAATDPIPTDSRLLVQLADGTSVGLPAGLCQDAVVGGATFDGRDLTSLFLGALKVQRETHDYVDPEPQPVSCEAVSSDVSPALPGHEHLVAGSLCGKVNGRELSTEEMSMLQEAWASATEKDGDQSNCSVDGSDIPLLFVRTDRGDNLQLGLECDDLSFYDWTGRLYTVDQSPDELLG